ncbi:Xaa-Pro peptidase family protein [Rhodobacteraceae bacterium N5(2021)]|uniref:Xaa-Pro peptidase family protein n=1 Tax=Gymnodinialimonas phycosphaerae TaxID=2841589 RepID=A0A975U058_9RHOB|nr:Xaa-Pro peptidase family protein [Gymnodinialimonas phycosphaerae]MBY4891217.1 Xaa-Pro peptidase family protein [Gymnodinialimonas phycosphaerae]
MRTRAEAAGLDGLLLLRAPNLAYATGLFLSANERPMGVWLPVEGDPILMLPGLERENAEGIGISDARFYDEFPGEIPAVLWMLDQIGRKRIAIDALDATLLDTARNKLERLDLHDHAMDARTIKEPEEVALTVEAASFADLFLRRIHAASADIISQGGTEADLMADAMAHARGALLAKHKKAFAGTPMGITASVHSGPRAALPHGAVLERTPQPGETLIAGIGASLGGYHAESGVTLIVGEISPEQRRIMTAMEACNDAAVAALARRTTCTQANDAALDALRNAGLGDAIRHRIGHGMGLEGHEAPWLAPGDATPIQTHMIFSNEPGVYRPGLDGYRTINTMIVTEDKIDIPSRFQADTPISARTIPI